MKLWAHHTESHGTGHAFLYPAKPCDESADMAHAFDLASEPPFASP
jgi:hypothetical protein